MPFFWNKDCSEKTLKDLISKLTDATHDQNRIINTLQDANKQLRTENEKQRKKYADLQEQLEVSKALEAVSLGKTQKHQTDTQSQLLETECRLKEAERTIQQTKKEKEDNERKINQLEINLLDFGKRIDELNKENLDLKDRVENICRERVILQRKTDTVEQERDTLKLRIDSWIAKKHSTGSRTVALVILHNNEYHALPKEPSERILIGSGYKHIGAIVDIAYLKHKGIYPCDMNESSLDKLVNFISTNS